MKMIVALVRPETLPAIQEALEETEGRLISASEVTDLRRPEAIVYRGLQYRKSRVRLRLEVVLENDAAVDDAVEAVLRAAGIGEGRRGGEDVFLMNVEDVRSMPARTTGVRRGTVRLAS